MKDNRPPQMRKGYHPTLSRQRFGQLVESILQKFGGNVKDIKREYKGENYRLDNTTGIRYLIPVIGRCSMVDALSALLLKIGMLPTMEHIFKVTRFAF